MAEDAKVAIDGVTARASEAGSELGQRVVTFSGRLALCGVMLTGAAATEGHAQDLKTIDDAAITSGNHVKQEKCEALAYMADMPEDLDAFHCTDKSVDEVGLSYYGVNKVLGFYDGLLDEIYILEFDDQTTRELLHTALHEKKHHQQFDNLNPVNLAKWAYGEAALEYEDRPYEQEAQKYADEAIKDVDVDKLETAFLMSDEDVNADRIIEEQGERQSGGLTEAESSDWVQVGDGPLSATVESSNLKPGATIELDDEYVVLASPKDTRNRAEGTHPAADAFRTAVVEDGSGDETYLPMVQKDAVDTIPTVTINDEGKIVTQFEYGQDPIVASWEKVSENDDYGIVMTDDGIAGLYDQASESMVVDDDWLK